MNPPWRLLLDAAADGPFNMGVDEALLASAIESGVATLRFYRWRGPWLSLGYSQAMSPRRRALLRGAGVGAVQRVTGGQAVLHGADLTYAVAAPEGRLPPGLRGSYELFGAALVDALQGLGVPAERAVSSRPREAAPFDCFARPAADELCVAGRKLVGSAQRRAGGGVLQHGSIRLAPDTAAARSAVAFDDALSTSLAEEGFSGTPEAVRRAVVAAFARHLDVAFELGALTPEEAARAAARGSEPLDRGPPASSDPSRGPSRTHLAGR